MKWVWTCLLAFLPFSLGQDIIRGANFFGLETQLFNTDYSWLHPASYYIDELGRRGFNYLRIPFSAGYVRRGDFTVMDEIFESAKNNNMYVLLDWHRNNNVNTQEDWLEGISIADYMATYKALIKRYVFNPQLRMVGLFNEYKGNDPLFWKQQMEHVVLELEQSFPNRFIWVIGCPQWSGNCHDMDWSHLPFYDRVRYDIHKYIFSIGGNRDYEEDWMFSFPKDHAKVIVGEWGFFSQKPEQVQWAKRFVKWLKEHNIHNSFFWVSVSNSGDTGGLWTDGTTFDEVKYNILQDLWNNQTIPHRHLEEVEMKYSPIPIPDQGCYKRLNNTDEEDARSSGAGSFSASADDEDDFDEDSGSNTRYLQGGRRRRKCHLIEETYQCVFHSACAWNKNHGCFKINKCFDE